MQIIQKTKRRSKDREEININTAVKQFNGKMHTCIDRHIKYTVSTQESTQVNIHNIELYSEALEEEEAIDTSN